MEKLLREIFGDAFTLYQKKSVKLPLYLKDNRSFFDLEIYGQRFVLVTLPPDYRFNITSLKKQYAAYSDKFQLPAAYGFERITAPQRKSLVESHIPFISENGQLFLPFIGTFFTKCGSGYISDSQTHFTPASQILFLLLLYGDDDLWINKGHAAKLLGTTSMSISRATLQLKQLGIIEEKNIGTEVRIHRILSKADAYGAAADHLIDPVQKVMYISSESNNKLAFAAGENALSFRSDLGYPDYKEYAVSKSAAASESWETCDPDLTLKNEASKIQIWKYAPDLFAVNDNVDPVSLICSFKGNRDERIHKCLENIKKEIETWQIRI